ncbi:hypothetical protein PVK06_012768 [Gossypium arboreum]|uniref:DDE Tnp4 domain-containing protein n=1 Tax=Gossypium arboreum TaxID=29729 RepID=A0ABR0QDE6_GOSAR|nr:hypothetical protein PVK06_012768 [Gossypium arboreum]
MFYPYFKDCIGALYGTHVRASVPLNIQGRFRSRKRGTTQNVLAAITFDLKFSYVLAGWKGSAHDSRILSDALSRPRGLRISEGKYYLADAGYGIRNGFITPYRGVRYHLKEFSAQGPENAKELFNLRHSSLRITIERVFGILKKLFRVLDAEPFWNFQTQVDIVLACCIIHNHIMGVDPSDLLNQGLYEEPESDLIISTLTEREEREEAREWSVKRDEIAQTMWTDYMARNIRMGKGNKEGTSKRFRWTKPIEHLFLEILADEAQKGNKPSNTFKAVSINRVVEAISEKFQVQCDAKHVENHLRTVKKQWQIICTIWGESGFGWDDNMKMITYMATGSFARTFADIDLDDDNIDSVPIDCENEATEEVRTNVSSSGTSKCKRKKAQESVNNEQIKFVGEQLGKIANALEQFTADKTPHLYEEVMSMEVEGFDDDFLCSVFDYLVSHESEAKAFLVKILHLPFSLSSCFAINQVGASIHEYQNQSFFRRSSSFFFHGGNEGLYATKLHVDPDKKPSREENHLNGKSFIRDLVGFIAHFVIRFSFNGYKLPSIICWIINVQKALLQSDVQSKTDKTLVTVADYGSQAVVSFVLQQELHAEFLLVAEEDSKDLRKDGAQEIVEHITKLVNDSLTSDGSYNVTLSTEDVLRAIDSGISEGGCQEGLIGELEKGRPKQYFMQDKPQVCLGFDICYEWISLQFGVKEVGCLFFAEVGGGTYMQPLDGSSAVKKLGAKALPVRIDSQAKYGALSRGDGAIYLQAGGVVTDAAGQPLDFSKGKHLDVDTGIIVSNQKLMPLLLNAVKESLKEKAPSS